MPGRSVEKCPHGPEALVYVFGQPALRGHFDELLAPLGWRRRKPGRDGVGLPAFGIRPVNPPSPFENRE
jgi:hypothetical protein